jgi:hypothetical protein
VNAKAEKADGGPSWLQRLLCRNCFKDESPPADDEEATPGAKSPDPDREGVAALLAIATNTVEDERERGRALDNKCGSLVGYTGAILTAVGLLAPKLVKHLGRVGEPVAKVAFVVAVVALLAGVLLALVGVLMPQKYRSLGKQAIAAFTRADVQAHDALWVHQSMLGSLSEILHQDRPVNDCKAKLTKWVAGCLAVAFVAVGVVAVVVAFHQFGV